MRRNGAPSGTGSRSSSSMREPRRLGHTGSGILHRSFEAIIRTLPIASPSAKTMTPEWAQGAHEVLYAASHEPERVRSFGRRRGMRKTRGRNHAGDGRRGRRAALRRARHLQARWRRGDRGLSARLSHVREARCEPLESGPVAHLVHRGHEAAHGRGFPTGSSTRRSSFSFSSTRWGTASRRARRTAKRSRG